MLVLIILIIIIHKLRIVNNYFVKNINLIQLMINCTIHQIILWKAIINQNYISITIQILNFKEIP